MGSTGLSNAIFTTRILPATTNYSPPPPALSLMRNSNGRLICSNKPSDLRTPFSRIKTQLVLSCGERVSGSGKDHDPRAVETVLKLYMAMKNKNFNEISDIIGEECLCICNFVSTFQPFLGKEQVLGFLSSLIKNLGNNIEFVVQPTFQDGMSVGVSWKLEWINKHRVPLGKGFSVYMCHVYQGKVLIRNIEMFLEPLLHIEPLRLRTMASLASAMEGVSFQAAKPALKILLALLFLAALLLFCRYPA